MMVTIRTVQRESELEMADQWVIKSPPTELLLRVRLPGLLPGPSTRSKAISPQLSIA
jgi:hypothetical protein